MSQKRQREERLRELLDSFQPTAAGAEARPLAALRTRGREAFAARGLPGAREEEWRYTPLPPPSSLDLSLPGADPRVPRARIEALSFPVFACSLFVFVNGRHRPELSAPHALAGGLRVESLQELQGGEPERIPAGLGTLVDDKLHPFAALGSGLLEDAAVVRIPRGETVEHVVHLVLASGGAEGPLLCAPRVWIDAEPGSRAVVLEDHVSLDDLPHLETAVTEVRVAEQASLDLVVLQRMSAVARGASNLGVQQEQGSRFASHVITLGGSWVRNDLLVRLEGEGAEAHLNGLFLGRSHGLVDNHTQVDHAAPHGTSRQLYKGILADRSRGVFRGRVVVRPHAQKTDAHQSNPNLLLSDGAEINSKPQLEIRADDVRCSHGSATGCVDPEALFYLRSRGIAEEAARRLLTQGFAAQVLAALPGKALAEALSAIVAERLGPPEEAS